MSRSTHVAIAGMQSAENGTHERCAEAVHRYGEVHTEAELRGVYAWAKRQDWFFRSAADDRAMRLADLAARQRVAAAKACVVS